MKSRHDYFRQTAMNLELPGESMPGVPIVEIFGNGRVLIEQHKGIVGYCCNDIKIQTKCGIYSVQGNKLEIARMTKHQIVIIGKIKSVFLMGE